MWHFVMLATARLIHFAGANHSHGVVVIGGPAINQALGAAGRRATYHTDGLEFVNCLCLGHEQWHWAKWFTPELHI
jgi:hypothetical protein